MSLLLRGVACQHIQDQLQHNEHRQLGQSRWYGVIVTLGALRLLTVSLTLLLHLCADSTIETKREEGEFMLYCDARVAQQRTVRAASLCW